MPRTGAELSRHFLYRTSRWPIFINREGARIVPSLPSGPLLTVIGTLAPLQTVSRFLKRLAWPADGARGEEVVQSSSSSTKFDPGANLTAEAPRVATAFFGTCPRSSP
jgi:hypothetical protein